MASIIAKYLNTDLIRLQCHEGLDVNSAVYEWNYQKQLLSIKLQETMDRDLEEKENHIFSEEFLLSRPLLQAISNLEKSPVLLIDEIDRADEEFEALLLELLSEFQISIPELKTIKAVHRPYVLLTSNRTRELSDALKRRCLYLWIDYPNAQKELEIVKTKIPDIDEKLASQVVSCIQLLRRMNLNKVPGVAETLDWVASLLKLQVSNLSEEEILQTLGSVLKTPEDILLVKSKKIGQLVDAAAEI